MESNNVSKGKFTFVNPNDNSKIEKMLHEIILYKLLDKMYSLQKKDG